MKCCILKMDVCGIFSQLAAAILAAGVMCIWINYDCDLQRQQFRKTDGKEKVWGKIPNKVC